MKEKITCPHWRANFAATWWCAVGFVAPSRFPLQSWGPLVGLGPSPGTRVWPACALRHYQRWSPSLLSSLVFFSFPRLIPSKCRQCEGFCPALAPKDGGTWNLRKQFQNVLVCVTEGINMSRKLCCIPCPIDFPCLKPSDPAEVAWEF